MGLALKLTLDLRWNSYILSVAEERANHLTGFFRNRENVGVPPKIKSEFKTKKSFKAWGLLEGRTVHLNRTKTWAVPLVMEGPKFGFRGVEGNKPPLAPL